MVDLVSQGIYINPYQVVPAVTDPPNWDYVLFQSDFEGTNNQQTSFADDTGMWTLTRSSGAGKLSSTQKLFGNTAAFTDASAQGWKTGQSPLWNLSTANSDAFTWEFSFYQTSGLATFDGWSILTVGGTINTWVRVQGDGNIRYLGSKTGSGFPVDITTTSGGMAGNVWNKVCIEKNTSGTIRIYINGVMRAKSTPADSILLSANDLVLNIGESNGNAPQNVYTDAMRITKGRALYDSDSGYTVATAAFPIGAPSNILLDGATGAWSASRQLPHFYQANSGAFYHLTSSQVDTWYDQTGNARDFAQATAVFRPQVAAVGGVDSLALKTISASGRSMTTAAALSTMLAAGTGYVIASFTTDRTSTSQANIYDNDPVWTDGTSGNLGTHIKSGSIYSYNWDVNADVTSGQAISINTPYVVEWRHEGGMIYQRVNGGTEHAGLSGNSTLTGLLRVGLTRAANPINTELNLFELATYKVIPTLAQRDAIAANMLAHVEGTSAAGRFVAAMQNDTSGTTHTFTDVSFGAAAAGRVIALSLGWADTALNGTSEITTITVGGVSATRATRAQGDNQFLNAEIWYATVASGTSGDIVVTNTGAALTRMTIAAYRMTGLNSATPTDTGVGTTTANVDIQSGDFVIAVGVRANTTATTLSNLTQDLNSTTQSASTYVGVHGSHLGTTTETRTTVISDTGNGPQIAMAAWR